MRKIGRKREMEGNLMAEREIRKDLFSWRRKRKKEKKKKEKKKSKKNRSVKWTTSK